MLAVPPRHPVTAVRAAGSRYLRPHQLRTAIGWLNGHDTRADDRSLAESFDAAGFTGPLRDVAHTFLAGVLADEKGETSAAFVRSLWWAGFCAARRAFRQRAWPPCPPC